MRRPETHRAAGPARSSLFCRHVNTPVGGLAAVASVAVRGPGLSGSLPASVEGAPPSGPASSAWSLSSRTKQGGRKGSFSRQERGREPAASRCQRHPAQPQRQEATPVGSALGGLGGEEGRGLLGWQPAVCHSGFYEPDHVLTMPGEGAALI